VMGRGIGVRDTSAAAPVAVVNQAFKDIVQAYADPIGHHFGSPEPDSTVESEIVGVVEDTIYRLG
jgi:macrolide transport system ATP-binding/permease protein